MKIMLTFIAALMGTAIGSFLNVLIDRLPSGKSVVYPPSHCDACQRRLSPKDNIPVFSYLWLRGRCRYCRVHIPARVFWMELVSGAVLALSFWYYGLSIEFATIAFYCYVFILLGIIDLERQLILNKIVYPVAVIALVINLFFRQPDIINSLIGGAIGFALLLIPILVFRGGMGWGDVKMAALIGLITGFPLVFVALLLAIVLGGVISMLLLLFKVKRRKDAIPFGPFLSLATIATLIIGSGMLHWYLGLWSI